MLDRIQLKENVPLNTNMMEALFSDKDDLYLVWPAALWPFDHQQWRKALDANEGHKSYFVYSAGTLIGHAALRKSSNQGEYRVSFLYIAPSFRSQGIGTRMLELLEHVAINTLNARKLRLVVRSYNPRAIRCYTKSGYTVTTKEGTAIRMGKELYDKATHPDVDGTQRNPRR